MLRAGHVWPKTGRLNFKGTEELFSFFPRMKIEKKYKFNFRPLKLLFDIE